MTHPNQTIDVRCPGCGFSPIEEARYTPNTDMPRTREEVLDRFEVLGADEGNVLCPMCSCEFDPETGEMAEGEGEPE